MGRKRCTGRRRQAFQHLHADTSFRKGLRRPVGKHELGAAVAITGQFGYSVPGVSKVVTATVDFDTLEQDIDTEYIPRVFNWGATLQYSMPYLKSAVVDLGLPDFINRLIPIVEASFQTPFSNTETSGKVNTCNVNTSEISSCK